ncbi:kinase-like domain-containing protein [Gilbertella persicaria]|uniref:kinase-like domain-containing protein n=1 Tax=Gilbertella persicaria TaxID=101096 RepID=UPI00221E4A2E|nr:kinase-like domain-containing protein [Gilbertella persicaria]KAI8080160.1 kinase-like domain-containing protein [Gilbertella persicaria]
MTRWFIHSSLRLRWKESKHLLDGRYKLIHSLGQGASGIVYLGIDVKTNQRYAIKELSKSRLYRVEFMQHSSFRKDTKKRKLNKPTRMIVDEADIMAQISPHLNIIKLIQVVQDPEYNDDSIFIVMELAEKGVVMDIVPHAVIQPYSDYQSKAIFRQLVSAVSHLHQHDVVHRDIKPQNLLMTSNNTLKLIDFGHATRIKDMKKTFHSVGSPAFMAPESIKKKVSEEQSALQADIWSMGITLYCLVYGRLPFEKSSLLDLFDDIQNKKVPHSDTIDPQLKHLINGMLEKDPKTRFTIKDIETHVWLL